MKPEVKIGVLEERLKNLDEKLDTMSSVTNDKFMQLESKIDLLLTDKIARDAKHSLLWNTVKFLGISNFTLILAFIGEKFRS